ncbi:L-fuconate dehydratase [Catalinimonas alkaloidigena]|uniref:L-fuconate dehydratase n=1 Tax=Catalinimonas alkaloidigena TaxID=1075417 RepID=UPI002405C25F|nr:L-fuconate dehydratase [Catalinimonas alkaloidigena]MDF9798607.1 L-fuconate dehydratase [Catalinimonas alkaloidigena]
MSVNSLRITAIRVLDIRFPTSRTLDGSDAMNPDPDYSAAYVILETNKPALEGHGLTFTIGRGNELCVEAIKAMSYLLKGKKLSEFTSDMAGFWRTITGDSQLRWLGPEKGVIHLATAAVVNAVWDLYAKAEKKPLWKLICDMSAEELVSCVDFTYLSDVITPEEAISMLKAKEAGKSERIAHLMEHGYPAYTTSAGWLGYSEEKIRRLCREAKEEGWKYIKMKVGSNLEDDMRRAAIIREEIGSDIRLMMDANQKWDVPQAICNMKQLARFDPWFIEEPTSPDDILGHKAIREAIAPVKVATGEHCHNRVIFKQMLQSGAMDFCQLDSCRLGGVNEILSVLLMAAKFNVPVCPHAGGVGLCEYVQHISMIDYITVSGSMENRIIEYVDHLHEHFIDPVIIRNAHYMPPSAAGYSISMKEESMIANTFPGGSTWQADN